MYEQGRGRRNALVFGGRRKRCGYPRHFIAELPTGPAGSMEPARHPIKVPPRPLTRRAPLMPTDIWFYLIGLPTVFVIGLGKGAFGGGLAIIGIPMLALVSDPVEAAIMVAAIACFTDVFALKAFPMRTWSWPDIRWLAPGMVVGLLLGTLFFVLVDPRILALAIAVVTLVFTARYFLRDRIRPQQGAPVSPVKALVFGGLGGFSTFISHAAAPPLSVYLIPRGLHKTAYAGTMVALLTMSNVIKIVPYAWIGLQRPEALWKVLPLLPMVPLGVWLGKVMHDRLDEQRLYFWCYLLVGAAGLKLLTDSLLRLAA